jgi:hypothetical protein
LTNYEEKMTPVDAFNLAAKQRMGDFAGENTVLVGTKARKYSGKEELVCLPFKERLVATVLGNPGAGKSVFAAQLAEYVSLGVGPLVVQDRKHEWAEHDRPCTRGFNATWAPLGFKPMPLHLRKVAPQFAQFEDLQVDVEWGLRLDRVRLLGPELAESVFSVVCGVDDSEATEGYRSEVDWLFKLLMQEELSSAHDLVAYDARYQDEMRALKKSSTVSPKLSNYIRMLDRKGIFFGQEFDLEHELVVKKTPAISLYSDVFPIPNDPRRRFFEIYEIFVAAQIYALSKRKLIPPTTEVYEEFDTALSQNISSIFNNKVTKQAYLKNNFVFVTQMPKAAPPAVLGFSDYIFLTGIRRDDWLDMVAVYARSPEHFKELVRDLDVRGHPKEWCWVDTLSGEYGSFYPLSPWSQFVKRV